MYYNFDIILQLDRAKTQIEHEFMFSVGLDLVSNEQVEGGSGPVAELAPFVCENNP